MMNDANQISAVTRLYGFIAEKAQSNRFSAVLNKQFKSRGDDAMIIPMNIRPDDLYFTVSGMRQSQLKGAVIAEEYRHDVLELLETRNAEVRACGFCDILHVKDEQLHGEIYIGKALAAYLNQKGVNSIAILGSGALAKSVIWHLKQTSVINVVLFNDRVESCMELIQSLGSEAEGIEFDIERVIEGETIDLSTFESALNASSLQNPGELNVRPAPLMIDLAIHNSLFKASADETAEYAGCDELLPVLTQSAYDIWKRME
jgi:shikimate 5-dehydrogenase